MPGAARLGDTISHGGNIIDASPNVLVNSIRVARLGDLVHCNVHGTQHITSASGDTHANGIGIARLGDSISCGAVITSASGNVIVN